MSSFARLSMLAMLCSATLCARAFTLEQTRSNVIDDRYEFHMTVLLDASPQAVESILRDYAQYPSLDPRITAAEIMSRPQPDLVVLHTRVRACFGWFCRTVQRTEEVHESPLELRAVADVERSDVRFGETRTRLSDHDGKTRVEYDISVVPDFWIPPLVGKRWMLKTLEAASVDLFTSIELRAREQASSVPPSTAEAP